MVSAIDDLSQSHSEVKMKLIITIDTEEDNWGVYSTTVNPVENVERIVPLQQLFDEFGVTPTYLVTYPVATSPRSVTILKRILDAGKCEIGMHCHPWNTPPFEAEEKITEHDTMLCNLPEELQYLKLAHLHETICKNFGVGPVSSRTGRWGVGPGVARSLCRLGYRVDTSVTPFVSWKLYQGPDYSEFGPDVFRFDAEGIYHRNGNGQLLQVPVTVGYLQKDFDICNSLMRILCHRFAKKFHLPGVLDRLGLLNKVWLSPELASVDSMIKLSKRMKKNNYSCLNMMFHSTSLLDGLSPFVRTKEAEREFFQKIRDFLVFARETGLESQTLVEFEESQMFLYRSTEPLKLNILNHKAALKVIE